MEHVILVDESDKDIGSMEKLEAHEKGLLHRAFSILIFNSNREMLIQKRSWKKYHSPGLWTNTCCSHPRPGEAMIDATSRKLMQEMGFGAPLKFAFKFIYQARLDNNLTEHELDHVYTGQFDGTPIANQDEVQDWRFVSIESAIREIGDHPDQFTYWFKLLLTEYRDRLPQ
jgi:isopentenyl-diphosphate delta-isomerase